MKTEKLGANSPEKGVVGGLAYTRCRLRFNVRGRFKIIRPAFFVPGWALEKVARDLAGKNGGGGLFLRVMLQSFRLADFPHLAGGWEKVVRDSWLEKSAAAGKIRCRHSDKPMKITVNIAALTNEQVKFLSQLGTFVGDDLWVTGCDPKKFDEAMELLKWAGIHDVFVEFGGS